MVLYRGQNLLLYADDAIAVVYKPAGLAVQTKKLGQKDLESLMRTWQAGQGAGTYIGIVHRLDQPVEGVMVLARTKEAAADLSVQAAGTGMQKTYVAVTRGILPTVEGRLQDYLVRDGRTNTSRVVQASAPGAKKAVLDYRVLETHRDEESLVEIHLHTGRHHQIRVQLAHAGAPLLGDAKYGAEEKEARPGGGMDTPALCACSLTFCHPVTGQQMRICCRPKNPAFAGFGVDKLPEPGIKYLT